MTRADDLAIKKARVREFMQSHGLGGVLFTLQRNFSWYTSGGQSHVAVASETGVASILATANEDFLVTNNIEAVRLLEEEELGRLGFTAIACRWDDDPSETERLIERVLAGAKHTTDSGPHAGALKRLRYSLTPLEVERYRKLGKDCAEAVADVCHRIEKGHSEWQIAGMTNAALMDRQIVPVVTLVAVDDRIEKRRHPIPTAKTLERYAMVVICGRRDGLILSTTRLVHFGKLPADLRRKHNACMAIDATYIGETTIGADVNEIFETALDMYERTGFKDEWMLHHQGGGTGYETRDFKGTQHSKEVVQPWQAYAWNPSITGTKSEDTVIATPDGPEVISLVRTWPMEMLQPGPGPAVARADILVR